MSEVERDTGELKVVLRLPRLTSSMGEGHWQHC